ncbi:MAG: FkbM family methyltransferase [Phycisphaeraceae bacterium]|nr:FkbM family methyltransferase [Phycisphaeraceae bacterium]
MAFGRLKTALKNVPFLGRILRFLKLSSPGRWIFKPRYLTWTSDRQITSQLPGGFRPYLGYVRLWRRILGDDRQVEIPGAIQFFALTRWLRSLFGRLSEGRITILGRIVHVDFADPRFQAVISEQRHPGPELSWLVDRLRPGDTLLDIGANHGSFSIVATTQLGAEGAIYAFEPQPRLNALVKRSLNDGPVRCWRVFDCALGAERGTFELFVPLDSSGGASLSAIRQAQLVVGRSIEVQVRTLDEVARELEIRGGVTIKLDVEGHETAVLRGGKAFLARYQPPIICELNRKAMGHADYSPALFIESAKQAGYRSFRDLGRPRDIQPIEKLNDADGRNIVLLPDDPMASPQAQEAGH